MNLLAEFGGKKIWRWFTSSFRAKEKIEIQAENQTLASITYQNYLNLQKFGCTGTAATESEEFFEIYNLNVVVIQQIKK